MARRPLEGIRVLDFTQAIAGPFATTLLADLGADVITIEPPGGASQRHVLNGNLRPNVTRNKRSIEVDLKADGARDVVGPLIERTDAIVHSYKPGTMERLGYGHDAVREYNEDVVYCSVSGFGEDGPYRDRMGFDSLAQAMSGLFWNTGEPDRKPSRIGGNAIDIGTGLATAFAVMVGLWDRERGGEGRKVETSLLDTAAMMVSNYYTRYSKTGETPQRLGHTLDSTQPTGMFETADRPIYLSCGYPSHWDRFCRVLGRADWIDDPRFETMADRIDNRELLHERIEAELESVPRAEIVDRLIDAGVPVVEAQTIAEAAEDEHLRRRETVRPFADVDGTEVLVAGHPIRFSDATPRMDEPIPEAGAHTREVLSEVGFSEGEIDEFLDREVVSSDAEG